CPPQNTSSVEPYRDLVTQLLKENVEIAAIKCRLEERGYTGCIQQSRVRHGFSTGSEKAIPAP
ncbi:MAG: hypothetical protein SXV54_18275, partial [Chloroflexota bacterium]|nr:hypothetical protein [Chloroflexota bacterium]